MLKKDITEDALEFDRIQNFLDTFLETPSKTRHSHNIPKSVEYFSKNREPTIGEFNKNYFNTQNVIFKDETGRRYRVAYGKIANEWYETNKLERMVIKNENLFKSFGRQYLFCVVTKNQERPNVGSEITAHNKKYNLNIKFGVEDLHFEGRKATGSIFADNVFLF